MRRSFCLSLFVLACSAAHCLASGTPDFGPNVLLFDPAAKDMQKQIDAIFATQEAGQFNDNRCAILFKPGKYALDVQVGFYTHVAGLGRSPDDVEITGSVRSKANWMRNHNATCNFSRAAENLSVVPTAEGTTNIWAVSQATALRRAHIKGDLRLSDGGWSSGGFLADSVIDGTVDSGSQQQWLSRNAQWSAWRGSNWNMVFVGTVNPPAGEWPRPPYTKIETAPIAREKPFLFVDESGNFFVMRPALRRDSQGVSWKSSANAGKAIPIEDFYIARADKDSAATINAALDARKHLLLTPGIYHLDAALRVSRADTIVLGLGYPTLTPDKGSAAISVADVDGVSIAGILLEAGAVESPTLLQIGAAGSSASHADNPTLLSDIFARAGGAAVGQTRTMVEINSSNVVGDNFWLWRADHGAGAKWDQNKNLNGLIVNGNDVTIYALMVEHQQGYQTIWNGERGRVYMYQSEMPYDPPNQEAWKHGDTNGFASYKVADNVTSHEAWGLGVYCVLRTSPIISDCAIEAQESPGMKFHHMVIERLNGNNGSGIAHVINDRGEEAITHRESKLDE